MPDFEALSHGEVEAKAKATLRRSVEELSEAQELLWASHRYALLVVFQAMDAAGKDSTIEHVMSGVNPQGVHVVSFRQPLPDRAVAELAHVPGVTLVEPMRAVPARVRAPWGRGRPNLAKNPRKALMREVRVPIHSERMRCRPCRACCSTDLTRTGRMSAQRAASSSAAASQASVLLRRT